jgi:hypothetical protein
MRASDSGAADSAYIHGRVHRVGYSPQNPGRAREELEVVTNAPNSPPPLQKCKSCEAVGPPCGACKGTGRTGGVVCHSCKGAGILVHISTIESCKG